MANPEWTDPEDWNDASLFDNADLAALTKAHRAAIVDAAIIRFDADGLHYRAPSFRALHEAERLHIAHGSDDFGRVVWLTPKGEAIRQHLMDLAGVVE